MPRPLAGAQFATIPKPSEERFNPLSPFAATHTESAHVSPFPATHPKKGGWGELWLTPPGTRPRYGGQAIFARKGGRTEWSRASFSVRFPVRMAGEQSVDESNLVADK